MINNKNSTKQQEEAIKIYIIYYILPPLSKIIKELRELNESYNIKNFNNTKEKSIDERVVYFKEIFDINNSINKYLIKGDKLLLLKNIEKVHEYVVKIKYEGRCRAELSYYLAYLYFHKFESENEKTINYAKDAIKYAQKHGMNEIECAAKGYMAMSLLLKDNIEKEEISIIEPYILDAVDHYNRLKDNLTLSLLYSFLACFYYSHKNNSVKSSELYKISYEYAKKADANSIKKDIKIQVKRFMSDSISKKLYKDAGYMSCALANINEKDGDKKKALYYYNFALNNFIFSNNIDEASKVRESMRKLEQELSLIQRWMSKLGIYNLF